MPVTRPLPLRRLDSALVRVLLVYQGVTRPTDPVIAADLTLSKAPAENTDAGPFYFRDKLGGGPLCFIGADYAFLSALNRSTARCTKLKVLVQHRGAPDKEWEVWTGTFTCNDISWDAAACTATVLPTPGDPYQGLLDVYDKPYNILLLYDRDGNPIPRRPVTAELASLSAGITIQFRRVGRGDEESSYLGIDGWSGFLENTSYIGSCYSGDVANHTRETNDLLFRYRLRNVPMLLENGNYIPQDMSAGGWQPLLDTYNSTTGTIDYAKAPELAGFKPYKIGTYTDWNDPRNPDSNPRYGTQLLLVDSSKNPSDYGFRNQDYIEVTGPEGGYPASPEHPTGGGGAYNEECPGGGQPGRYLQVRRCVQDDQCSKLYWRFGQFTFGQCFPLLDGLYSLLSQTAAPAGLLALLPPTAAQLSSFFSQPVNQATGQTGLANELPRLLLSAGSDVKRYGASEPATRLLISLKQFLADLCALYDCGWFIDPATGYLRIEHRAWLESQVAGRGIDLQALPKAQLPTAYTYRTSQLPRYEELTVSNAVTEDISHGVYFTTARLDYGTGGCVNQREGQNTTTQTASRLTGDVTGGVLNGDQLPDTCLFILAPDLSGSLPNANRELSPTQLLYRYYRRGRPAAVATIEGPAPQQAPNTVTGALPVTGFPAIIESVRPPRQQENVTAVACVWSDFGPGDGYTTNLGDGAQLSKADLNLTTRAVKSGLYLPDTDNSAAPPAAGGRQFDASFSPSFA